MRIGFRAILLAWIVWLYCGLGASAQARPDSLRQQTMQHAMPMLDLGGGWMLIGMAQAFPALTTMLPHDEGTPLGRSGVYLTQPAAMFNLESPASRIVLRTTLNFEGATQPWGELTFGDWGEGFLDKRHPHTLLHEFMLSYNVHRGDQAGWSVSLGRGFAPYGTDDPMSRAPLKYPTNHHLSQVLERWTLSGVWWSGGFSAEAGIYSGEEPIGPYDTWNTSDFGRSWSVRLSERLGGTVMGISPWEFSASVARVREPHKDTPSGVLTTTLFNAAARHEADHRAGHLYALVEASVGAPQDEDGYFSVLGEASLQRGAHLPYARLEYASRPEFMRDGGRSSTGFFRYDHDLQPLGATRWLVVTAGYGVSLTGLPYSLRPFVEAEWYHVSGARGPVTPDGLYGRSSFGSVSAGFRVFLGGGPMRMGAYGVLDPMTMMHRMDMKMMPEHHH